MGATAALLFVGIVAIIFAKAFANFAGSKTGQPAACNAAQKTAQITMLAFDRATLLEPADMRLAQLGVGFLHVAVQVAVGRKRVIASHLHARLLTGVLGGLLAQNLAALAELAARHRPQASLGVGVQLLSRHPA